MNINKENLILSTNTLQENTPIIDLGNGIFLPIDNNNQIITLGQIIGYNQNNQAVIQQFNFQGKTTTIKDTITCKLHTFETIPLSLIIYPKETNKQNQQCFGEYINTYYSNNITQNIYQYNQYILKYFNGKWKIQNKTTETIYYQSTETINLPNNTQWVDIIIQINENIKSNNLQLYICKSITENKWIGTEIKILNDQIIQTSHSKQFDLVQSVNLNQIYCINNGKIII